MMIHVKNYVFSSVSLIWQQWLTGKLLNKTKINRSSIKVNAQQLNHCQQTPHQWHTWSVLTRTCCSGLSGSALMLAAFLNTSRLAASSPACSDPCSHQSVGTLHLSVYQTKLQLVSVSITNYTNPKPISRNCETILRHGPDLSLAKMTLNTTLTFVVNELGKNAFLETVHTHEGSATIKATTVLMPTNSAECGAFFAFLNFPIQ